jgi:hypothetical protein
MNDQLQAKEAFEIGLDYYNPEFRVFDQIATKISKGQDLTKQDVLQILKWKLGRIKDSNNETVRDENLVVINKAVKDASSADGVDALEALEKIPGIGLATATAILTVCYPDKFTIIDWRVLEILELIPSRMQKSKQEYSANDWSPNDYISEYLPAVKKLTHLWNCTLRDADRALWGFSVKSRIEEVINIEFSSQAAIRKLRGKVQWEGDLDKSS